MEDVELWLLEVWEPELAPSAAATPPTVTPPATTTAPTPAAMILFGSIASPSVGAGSLSPADHIILGPRCVYRPGTGFGFCKDDRMVAVSRFEVPRLEDLPDDVRARIDAVQERSGFVPNVFLVLAHRPAEFRAFVAYHDALMDRDDGLSRAEREMIVVATSAVNDCLYCVVAHGAVLRIRAKDPLIADYLAVDYRRADLPARQRAIVDVAVTLAEAPQTVGEADLDRLRDQGLDDEEIWDVGAITALFALSNRMAQWTGMAPNEEFHLMGRVPRS